MNHPSCVSSFIRAMMTMATRGFTEVKIHCNCDRSGVFPNACLPISALIYKSSELFGVNAKIAKTSVYLQKAYFSNPLDLKADQILSIDNPLNKVFQFSYKEGNENQIASIVQAYINYLSKTFPCETGVLDGLTWCINEVMDNVLVHSKMEYGYIMAQFHRKKERLAICVFDTGIGIYNSLIESGHHTPGSELDSITLALQEGVGDGKGQGNGLFGLFQIINSNNGQLSISTGKSSYMLKKGETKHYDHNPLISIDNRTTTVDFQLDLSQSIDVIGAFQDIGGFDGFDLRLDNMWEEGLGYRYDVFENSSGTGTRVSGEELRLDIMNIIKRVDPPVYLDFSKVQTCSSSFIDEFLVKLYCELSPEVFDDLIKVTHINHFIEQLFKRSLKMRLSDIK